MVGDPASDLVHSGTAVGVERQLITVDDDGVLWSSPREPLGMTMQELYAVLVLWDGEEGSSWLGWLTTTNHRSACFAAADLADPRLRRWLRDLAGWDWHRLVVATTCPGLHLVWRARG